MKNKLVRNLSRFFVLLLALFLLLWLSSPFWSRFALQFFLPQHWKLTRLEMSLPGFSSTNIKTVQISLADGKQLTIHGVSVPYFHNDKTITIDHFLFNLADNSQQEKSDTASNNKSFKLPALTAIELPFLFNIKQAEVRSGDFYVLGKLQINTKALSFEGDGHWQNISQAVDFYISGIDGKTDLNLAASVGKQQHFSLNYRWHKQQRPQQLQLSANVKTEFLQLLQNLQLISAKEITFSEPELAISAELNWPKFPEDITQLLQAKIKGEAEIVFDKLTLKNATVSSNRFRAKFNNQKISFVTDQPIHIVTVLKNQPLQIKTNSNEFILSFDGENNLSLQKFPVINMQWQGQNFQYENQSFLFNTRQLSFSGEGLLNGQIIPEKLLPKIKKVNFGKYKISSHVAFSNIQNKLRFQSSNFSIIQSSRASIVHESSIQNIEITLKQFHLLQPSFQINLNLKQHNLEDSFFQQLDTSGQFNFKIISNDLIATTHCLYQINPVKVGVQCGIIPDSLVKIEKSITENDEVIKFDSSYHFKTSKLNSTFSAKKLSSKFWPVSSIYTAIKQEQWTLNFNLSSIMQLKKTPIDTFSIFSSITDKSKLSLNAGVISAFDYQFSDLYFSLKKALPTKLEAKINLNSIQQKQGFTLNDLKSDLSLTDLTRLNAKVSFSLFSGLFDISIPETDIHQQSKAMNINVTQLNLDSFFKFLDIKGFSASGLVDGSLPVTVNKKGIIVKNGELHSTSKGVLKYISPTDTTPFEQQNIAMQALQDFQYENLTITIEQMNLYFNQPGRYKLPMRIIGKNPKLLMGKSIALNPVLKGKIPKEAWHYFISKDIKQALTDKLKK